MNRYALAFALALVGLAGCGDAPHAPAHLSIAEDNYLFDTVRGGPVRHKFQWRNDGGTATGELQVTLTGDLTALRISQDDCGHHPLLAGHGCAVEVELASEHAGAYAGQLHIVDNTNTVAGDCIMSGKIAPADIAFDTDGEHDVIQGSSGAVRVTVRNDGGGRSGVLSVAKPTAGEVILDFCSHATLAGGQDCHFDIRYLAGESETGNPSAQVVVASSAEPSLTVDAKFHIIVPGALVVDDVDFGSIDPERASHSHLVKVSNPGPLTAYAVAVGLWSRDGSSVAGLSILLDQCSGQTLAVGASCVINLAVVPDSQLKGTHIAATLGASASGARSGEGKIDVEVVNERATVFLTRGGSGSGTIKEKTNGTDFCSSSVGDQCAGLGLYPETPVVLTAVPNASSTFVRWTGCTTVQGNDCTIRVTTFAQVTVTAEFAAK